MNKLYNRVKVTTPTAGTGTVTLSTAVSGFLTFAQGGVNTGEVVTYLLEEGTSFEVGQGIYTSSGLTLSRNSVYRSTGTANIGKITLVGSATVAIVSAAEDIVSPTRTNYIRNNSMQGTVAGSSGTLPTNWSGTSSFGALTRTIVGRGLENGIDYIEIRYNGTTNTTTARIIFEAIGQIGALDAQIWTTSAYLSLVAGSWTNVTSIQIGVDTYASGSVFINSDLGTITNPTSTQNRFSRVSTLSGGTIAFVIPIIRFIWTSGVAVDFTLRVGMPQIELGNGFTDVIRTNNNVVVTRNFNNVFSPPTPRQNFYSHLTVGSVLFIGTGSELAQDNANLFWDDTNNRLGIGNILPQTNLHIGGTSATFRVSNLSTDASNGEWFEASWSTNVLNLGTNFNGAGVTRSISFRAGGVEAINLSTAALVKVSTTLTINATPSTQLFFIGGTHTTSGAELARFTPILVSSATSSQYGIFVNPTFNPSGASLANVYGAEFKPELSASSSKNITFHIGVLGSLSSASGYSGVISTGTSFFASDPNKGAGNNPWSTFGGFFVPEITNGNGITTGTVNNYGLRVIAFSAAAAVGGVVNNYGAYISVPNGDGLGTNTNRAMYITGNGPVSGVNHAIYSDSTDASLLFGRLGIGASNGQSVGVQYLTELTTIAAAATTDTTIQIPAGSLVIGVSVRVTVVVPTATTFDYGISGATTRYGTGISTVANTTSAGTIDAIRYYAAATSIRITPNLTPGANSGRIRVTIFYLNIVPPTS